MYNLYSNFEYIENGFNINIIDFLSLLAIISAISVIIAKNPIVSVLFLIALFFSIANYLIIIGFSFIGLSYLLVYVGAVSILFLFILMLINIRISELYTETSNSIPLVLILSISLITSLVNILPEKTGYKNPLLEIIKFNSNLSLENKDIIYYVSSNKWDNNLFENTHISTIGNVMYSNYAIFLIITSLILLLAMVGAIIITINNDKK